MKLTSVALLVSITGLIFWLLIVTRSSSDITLYPPSFHAAPAISKSASPVPSSIQAIEIEKKLFTINNSTSPPPLTTANAPSPDQYRSETPPPSHNLTEQDFSLDLVTEINGSLPESFEWIKQRPFAKMLSGPITVTQYERFFIVDPPNSTILVVSLVVSVSGKKSRYMASIEGPSTQNKFRYALGCHQYSLAVIHESLDRARVPNWSKIRGLSQLMQLNNSRYEWLFWIDADALFMNLSLPIESLIVDRDAHLFYTHDHNGFHNGVFLIRKSAWSQALLDATYFIEKLKPEAFRNSTFHDQDAMGYMVSHAEDRSKLRQLPKRSMNSYDDRVDNRSDYQRGDFIVHQPGCTLAKKQTVCANELIERAANAIPCKHLTDVLAT